MDPELFVKLNKFVVNDFYRIYEADGGVRRWRGRRVCGMAGCYLNLPETRDLRAEFGPQAWYPGMDNGLQALSSICYDLLNDVVLSAGLCPQRAEKRPLIEMHKAGIKPGDIMVLDQGDVDYEVMAAELQQGHEFVIRFRPGSLEEADKLRRSEETERVVELELNRGRKVFTQERWLPERLQVRMIKVASKPGDHEVLGTSLLDTSQYPTAELKQVFGWRWGPEMWIGHLKNIIELEQLRGKNRQGIEQDFYGLVFLVNLESILSKSVESQSSASGGQSGSAFSDQANHPISYLTLVDRAVSFLLDSSLSLEQVLEALHRLFKNTSAPSLIRRTFSRRATAVMAMS